MNEDDTFRRLKKVPYDEIKSLMRDTEILRCGNSERIAEFLDTYGWTIEEVTEGLINELKNNGFGDVDGYFKNL